MGIRKTSVCIQFGEALETRHEFIWGLNGGPPVIIHLGFEINHLFLRYPHSYSYDYKPYSHHIPIIFPYVHIIFPLFSHYFPMIFPLSFILGVATWKSPSGSMVSNNSPSLALIKEPKVWEPLTLMSPDISCLRMPGVVSS